MINIKKEIKRKMLKEKISKKITSIGYLFCNLLAYIEDKINDYKIHKYNLKQEEISKWTDEYAIGLCSEVLIKDMIKHNKNQEDFIVSKWCNTNYNLKTIKNYMTEQKYNNDLQNWSYKKLLYADVDKIEKLTELLKIELEKYDEIKCEYIIDKNKYSYCDMSNEYKNTLIVRIERR